MNVGLMVTLLVGGLGIGGTVGYVLGLDQGKKQAVSSLETGGSGSQASDGNQQLFYYNNKVYTSADLPAELQSRLYNREMEGYRQSEGLIKEFAMRLALASEKNKPTDFENLPELQDLLDKPTISDAELKAFYEENKSRLPANTSFDQIKPRLEQFLANQKSVGVFQEKWDAMEKAGTIKLLLPHPVAPLVSIPENEFPTKGAETARYTLVEVSDYLCPHCQSVHPQVVEAAKELGDKVKFVQINFSLRPDQLSGSLIQGAYCAQKLGNEQFWKYHNAAFENEWGKATDAASNEIPLSVAKKAGLDEEKMKACIGSEEAVAWVEKTRGLADSLGVTGTPTFFFNNRRLGHMHGTSLSEVIKEKISELEKTGT